MLRKIARRAARELRKVYSLLAMLLPSQLVTALADEALRFRHRLNDTLRHRKAKRSREILPPMITRAQDGSVLQREILDRHPSWSGLSIPPCPVPTMLTLDEMRYYRYITGYYSGAGEVVEIGPWIGSSTFNIIGGLLENPAFTAEKKVHVYDDFVWRSSWMEKWLTGTDIKGPGNHESFLPLFHEMTHENAERIEAQAMKLMDAGDNSDVPWFAWGGGLVELCFIDCGRTLEMNETWYKELQPYFIPDRTIIVMQDWQNFKNVPEVFWENTKIFTDSKGPALDQIHELRNSGTATFIYRG
jgi:hypothetical protein